MSIWLSAVDIFGGHFGYKAYFTFTTAHDNLARSYLNQSSRQYFLLLYSQ